MKKVLVLAAMFLITSVGMIQAQTSSKEQKKEERKEKREERKAANAAQEEISFEQAYQALKDQSFVLEADNVIFWNGVTRYVFSNTNFVALNKGDATVQTAFNNGYSGPNGIGGVTLDGSASYIKMNTDRDGNVFFSMSVQGINISATVDVILTKGTNRASVTINPNFSGNTLTMTGNLYPTLLSNIYKATPTVIPNMLNPRF